MQNQPADTPSNKATDSIQSMTGFAAVVVPTRSGGLSLEMRSVNSRFLDIQVRMPDELRLVEAGIREALSARLQRGKVECRLNWVKDNHAAPLPRLQTSVLKQLADLENEVRQSLPGAGGFRVVDVLNWPGALEDNSLTTDELRQVVQQATDEALDALIAARLREGARLAAVLTEKIEGMQAVLATLEPRLSEFLQAHADKITARLQESLSKAMENTGTHPHVQELHDRIRQEVSIHHVRVDVAEELDRLKTHFIEIKRNLKSKGPVGKRLDFLTQELNREANTLGSKSTAIEQTQASIELKVLIEQVREQVQNLE